MNNPMNSVNLMKQPLSKRLSLFFIASLLLLIANLSLASTPSGKSNMKSTTSNRLATESSPYLQLHAKNPVDWYPWGKDAFEKAKKENKPIFLSIGYSTCYWCHVMERESFSNPQVAKLMNRYFVNIKVDREERPDVDEVYITALQLMNGYSGWPVSIWLTPDLKPFFGSTYIPKDQFIALMKNIHEAWNGKHHQEILLDADQVTQAIHMVNQLPTSSTPTLPPLALIQQAAKGYQRTFDATHGGFLTMESKFPQVPILQLLLVNYQLNQDKTSLQMVEKTLNAMQQGGIHDQVGGGLHRYATDRQWQIPHFEKMLYDQAQALMVYAQVYQITNNPNDQRMANHIVSYLKDKLLSPEGLFYSAEDAETNANEGETYLWTAKALQQSLTPKQWQFVKKIYDTQTKTWGTEDHQYQGIILQLKANPELLAQQQGISSEVFHQQLNAINKQLLQARHQRPQPRLDDKIITAWNGLTIEALAYAGKVFNNPDDIQLAKQAGNALWAHLHSQTIPLYHVMRHGKAKLPAYLDDYAATILGFTALYQATQDIVCLDRAKLLANTMIQKLQSPEGYFYYAEPDTAHLLTHQQLTFDGATPSGNSLAVRALVSLAQQTHDAVYAQAAKKTLQAYAKAMEDSPERLPTMLWGLYQYDQRNLSNTNKTAKTTDQLHSSRFVNMQVSLIPNPIKQQDASMLKVTLTIDKGWHINANPASLKFLIPTAITIKPSQGQLQIKTTYPSGKTLDIGLGQPIQVYSDQVVIPSDLQWKEKPKSTKQPTTLTISATVQACNDKGRCLLPDIITQTVALASQ